MKPARLNFADLAAVRAWLDALKTATADLAAVASDQTAAPSRRRSVASLARPLAKDASKSISSLIAYARKGLRPAQGTGARRAGG